jgi:hypothetical protein
MSISASDLRRWRWSEWFDWWSSGGTLREPWAGLATIENEFIIVSSILAYLDVLSEGTMQEFVDLRTEVFRGQHPWPEFYPVIPVLVVVAFEDIFADPTEISQVANHSVEIDVPLTVTSMK